MQIQVLFQVRMDLLEKLQMGINWSTISTSVSDIFEEIVMTMLQQDLLQENWKDSKIYKCWK
jgi:hypothetical protein